jgi:hypothetical protein
LEVPWAAHCRPAGRQAPAPRLQRPPVKGGQETQEGEARSARRQPRGDGSAADAAAWPPLWRPCAKRAASGNDLWGVRPALCDVTCHSPRHAARLRGPCPRPAEVVATRARRGMARRRVRRRCPRPACSPKTVRAVPQASKSDAQRSEGAPGGTHPVPRAGRRAAPWSARTRLPLSLSDSFPPFLWQCPA